MYSNKDSINILTAVLVQYGVRHIVVCPGSRNAPLVHNFSECPDIICHPVTDERSAGFIALGIRQALNELVAVCVTSGSALLNVLPAAAEATYQHQGIIVISADRPAAWIDQLDGQTIPQPGALGTFVTKSVTLPEPHDMTEVWHCKRLVCEAIIANMVAPYPSVHINVPLSEPLFEFTNTHLPDIKVVIPCQWSDTTTRQYLLDQLQQAPRPMIVIGQLPNDTTTQDLIRQLRQHIVILCEQLSSADHTLIDQMLHALAGKEDQQPYQPSHVIYLGGHTISKRLRHFLRNLPEDTEVFMVTEDHQLHDISQHASWLIEGDATDILNDILSRPVLSSSAAEFHHLWHALEATTLAKHLTYTPAYSQLQAVMAFEQHINPTTATIFYANSMAIRLAAIYANHYCHCNRGINGIEGSLSVAVGAAIAPCPVLSSSATEPSPRASTPLPSSLYDATRRIAPCPVLSSSAAELPLTYCIIGDLSFFYDENALWQQQLTGSLRILLLNNSQGGIFRNLKGLEQSPVRDTLISAQHTTSAQGICQQFNVTYLKATDTPSLLEGINTLTTAESPRPILLEVITDPTTDSLQYQQYYNHIK